MLSRAISTLLLRLTTVRYARLLFVCLAGGIILIKPVCATQDRPAALIATDARPQRFPQPNWNLKYSSGSLTLTKNQWLKAAFITGPATGQLSNPTVTISMDQLREIYFSPQAEKDSDTMQQMSRSGCGYAKDLMPKDNLSHSPGTFVAWVISPGTVRRAAEHLNARYSLRFVWSDSGSEKDLVFSVRACEYSSFLANLRWIVGRRWKDIEHEFPQ